MNVIAISVEHIMKMDVHTVVYAENMDVAEHVYATHVEIIHVFVKVVKYAEKQIVI